MSQSNSDAVGTQEFSAGIYKSYSGMLTIVALLAVVAIMGLVSYHLNSLVLIRSGILLIILAMALDLVFVQKRILKNKMYVLHHSITAFWAFFGLLHAEFITQYKFGVLVYMLLGALFRRLWKISKDFFPESFSLHWSIQHLMIFFDFCDPLVIWLLWDWVETLPLGHKIFYFGLAGLRLVINAKAYPTITRWFGEKSKN